MSFINWWSSIWLYFNFCLFLGNNGWVWIIWLNARLACLNNLKRASGVGSLVLLYHFFNISLLSMISFFNLFNLFNRWSIGLFVLCKLIFNPHEKVSYKLRFFQVINSFEYVWVIDFFHEKFIELHLEICFQQVFLGNVKLIQTSIERQLFEA